MQAVVFVVIPLSTVSKVQKKLLPLVPRENQTRCNLPSRERRCGVVNRLQKPHQLFARCRIAQERRGADMGGVIENVLQIYDRAVMQIGSEGKDSDQ